MTGLVQPFPTNGLRGWHSSGNYLTLGIWNQSSSSCRGCCCRPGPSICLQSQCRWCPARLAHMGQCAGGCSRWDVVLVLGQGCTDYTQGQCSWRLCGSSSTEVQAAQTPQARVLTQWKWSSLISFSCALCAFLMTLTHGKDNRTLIQLQKNIQFKRYTVEALLILTSLNAEHLWNPGQPRRLKR